MTERAYEPSKYKLDDCLHALVPRKTAAKQGCYTPQEVIAMLKRSKGRVRNVAPRSQRTYAGVVYDSKAEALYAFELDKLKAAGKISDWSRQVRIPLIVDGTLVCHFVVDFCVYDTKENVQEFHEVKGWETPEYKLKLKLFRAIFPKAVYKIVRVK